MLIHPGAACRASSGSQGSSRSGQEYNSTVQVIKPTSPSLRAPSLNSSPRFRTMSYTDEKLEAIPGEIHTDVIPRVDEQPFKELQAAEQDAHLGVKAVEAAEKVYGRYSKWFLFIGCVLLFLRVGVFCPRVGRWSYPVPPSLDRRLGLASYVYCLGDPTTKNYLAFATSAFGKHSLISTIIVAESIVGACGKYCSSTKTFPDVPQPPVLRR